MPNIDETLIDWYRLGAIEVLSNLQSREGGLSEEEARRRLLEYGPNRLPHEPPPTIWEIGLRQFKSPLIYILAIAAVVSILIGETTDAAFIAAVLGLNALIGGYQEWRAEKSSLALRKLLQIKATVERAGEIMEISAEDLVPGDIVWLESGNRVPADVRLLSSYGLQIDESLLTGESVPVSKDAAWQSTEDTVLAEQKNMAFAGSTVVRGRAKGVVAATGNQTSVGQLALDVLTSRGGDPPLLVRMERFTRVIAFAVLVAAVTIGIFGITLHEYPLSEMFLIGVALAVSAIPEGLPVAMTVALSIATTRMAQRGVIVRRLAAVEGLGSCTLIATDKTGTLTRNELMVRRVYLPGEPPYEVTGEGYIPTGEVLRDGRPIDRSKHERLAALARTSVLCNEGTLHSVNDTWSWRGDSVDLALLALGHKLGYNPEPLLDKFPRINQIPFEAEHRFAASFHQIDGEVGVFVKGAPERVLEMCSLETDERNRQLERAETLAAEGYRVLALAQGRSDQSLDPSETPPAPSDLKFLGFVGMIDPLRSGVVEAVEAARRAGIEVTMVTGDHRITAEAIARELSIATRSDQVMTGDELEEHPTEKLPELIDQIRVFARVTPRQKLTIVEAARQQGHFVAVTGDGVNDAPALKNANIGVAMGRSGTDVARESAEIVISDDNFSTIVNGIEEGRIAYDNIRKVIYLLISTGAAEVVLVGLSVLAGMPLPLLPVQLLWLNLVTNGIQDVALAFEPGEEDALERPPRPSTERIFNRLMVERTVIAAAVIACLGFGTFSWMLEAGWSEAEARNGILLLFVLFQNIHVGNSRSETKSVFRLSPLRSPILMTGVLLAFSIHMAAMHLPFTQQILGTAPVDLPTWGTLILIALSILPVMELHKWTWKRRFDSRHSTAARAP